MAYSAVTSLINTIHRYLNSPRLSIVSSSREMLESAHTVATSLRQTLKRSDCRSSVSKRLDALDGRIREAVHELEDVLEFHESNLFSSSQYGDYSSRVLSIDLEVKREEIHSLMRMMRMMEEEYVEELDDGEDDDDEEDLVWYSSSDFGVESMVGLSDEYEEIKVDLNLKTRPDDWYALSIFGMPGSCVTLIARDVFDDLYFGEDDDDGKGPLFDCGAWVIVGPNYEFREILARILAQIDDDGSYEGEYLHTSLKGRRYMIALDDVRDRHVLYELMRFLPVQDNGSVLMYTTSVREVFDLPTGYLGNYITEYNEQAVCDMLRLATFGVEQWPPELEAAAKKIARNTRGGRLQIAKAMLFLWKAEKTPEYWNKLAADRKHPVFVVNDELSEIRKINEEEQQLYNSVLDDNQRQFVDGYFPNLLDYSKPVEEITMKLFPKRFFPKMEVISFYGMAGIGKTTFVKKLLADPSVFHDIDHRAWITLGPKYYPEDIFVDILAQIYPEIDKRRIEEDAELSKALCANLSLKKSLIVLDDVWSQKPFHYLKKLFPNIKGTILVTTRLLRVAQFRKSNKVYEVRLLNLEESWCLFCRKVFVNGLCPPELEQVGKKISEICEGLPLLILTVANLLSKVEMTPQYWNKVAEKKNSLFADAHNEISKALRPSYKGLPQHLKPCFLYMGVFPHSYQIHVSKLINLWSAEGSLIPNSGKKAKDIFAKYLLELSKGSLVIVCQMGSNSRVKTYRLHSVFWHLSVSEASRSTFFHALNYPVQDIQSQRRLCIRNNILLSIKDVHNSIASSSTAHSFLCTGLPHQYQVPIDFDLRLVRVIDALTIRLYEFPINLVKLIHLRYLSLTFDGKLPASISKLWNLQYLIVGRHLCLNSSEDSLYLPAEIWDMKELRHLQIMGRCLPNPNCGALLPKLLTLLDVSAQSCTKRVLKRIPNVKKLGIQIELDPDGDGNPFHCLNRIWRLRKLESLKCIVVNPELRSKVGTPPAPLSMFPARLKKLSLSGLGYPWEYMSIIGNLNNLEVIKLRCFAFRGTEWKVNYRDFMELKFLSIEDTDLERWGFIFGTLEKLKHLSFKHCYKLKKLPDNISSSVENLEIIDCNPLVDTWVKQMKDLLVLKHRQKKHFNTQSSW